MNTRGDPKITGIIFLNGLLGFILLQLLVSFKVLSFWLDTLVPMFSPFLKTFLELFSALMLFKTSSVFFFTSLTSAKRFPFIWPFMRGGTGKSRMAQGRANRKDEETDFPNRKQNFTHTFCSWLSAIIKIAELPSRHLGKKATTTITVNLDWRHAADC